MRAFFPENFGFLKKLKKRAIFEFKNRFLKKLRGYMCYFCRDRFRLQGDFFGFLHFFSCDFFVFFLEISFFEKIAFLSCRSPNSENLKIFLKFFSKFFFFEIFSIFFAIFGIFAQIWVTIISHIWGFRALKSSWRSLLGSQIQRRLILVVIWAPWSSYYSSYIIY